LKSYKRWGYKGEPFFSLWKIKEKSKKDTETENVLGGLLGKEITGLVNYTPVGEKFRFYFPSLFTKRHSGFEGEWTCIKIGSGGYSTVYSCCQGDKYVALKVPKGFEAAIESMGKGITPAVPMISVELINALKNEFEIIQALNHPHLLKPIAFHGHKGFYFLVYEFANYGSLEYQLKNGAFKDTRSILTLTIQLADALRYLHSHEIIHGDVKPSNILFVNKVAKLGDYSIAIRTIDTARKLRIPLGTPGWRAPEQVDAELEEKTIKLGYQHKIDIYQLGNLLLFLLTGEKLDGEEILLHEDYLKKVLDKVNDQLIRKLLGKMLQKIPWDRISIEAVIDGLIKSLYVEQK